VESDHSIFDWIVSSEKMLADDVFVSKHLDDYFADDDDDAKVPRAIEAYEETVDFIRSKNLVVQAILVLPLETLGSQISMIVPATIGDVVGMLDKLEPPSMYLLRGNLPYLEQGFEEYRLNLPKNILNSKLADLKVLYREFRDEKSTRNNWEFSRCLYVNAFRSAH
jgi:hypothetical protein